MVPSPAVLEAATARGLGEFVRGYTAASRVSDTPPASKGRQAVLTGLGLAATALPLALSLLVAWWLGLVLLAAAAVALVVWLRKPVKHVYEFRAGLVAQTKEGPDTVRWDEVATVYQDVAQFFVNGVYGGTNHGYRLVTRDGRHLHVGGSVNEQNPAKSLTQIDQLGEVLLREIPPRHLQKAVDTLNSGGDVLFDGVTINLRGITVPAGTASWHELRNLAVGSGVVWLHTANKKPWQVKIAEIPNHPIFWTLAKELHTQAHQR